MQLLVLFIVLSVLNVILNTVKSIVTIKGGKMAAALINAITFFVYTYVIIYTNCDLNMHLKAGITAFINFIGVYVVKLIEEKARKDKLWKIDVTIPERHTTLLHHELVDIPHNYTFVGRYTTFTFYCESQKDTAKVKKIADKYQAKYFVTENHYDL